MKKIILPTDFSENAYNAICYALQLFSTKECTFYIMNTYTPAVYQAEYVLHSPGQIGLGDIYQSHSTEQLESLKNQLERQFNNPLHTIFIHSAFNTVVDEVVAMVESEGADLVIMGTQGATGAKEILLGTHTVHVMKRLACPLIVVPSEFSYKSPAEILFPTDYEVDYDCLPLSSLLDIAEIHKSRFEIMHVSSGYELTGEQKQNMDKLKHLLSNSAQRYHDLPSQEIITAINNFQLETPVNFLIMVRNKHTFMERLFIDPVIKKIAFHVNIPFMVVPC